MIKSGSRSNEKIRRRTTIADIAQRVPKLKWQWVWHTARRTEGLWGPKSLEWCPRRGNGSVSQIQTRRTDDNKRIRWKPLQTSGPGPWIVEVPRNENTYVQQSVSIG
ncbi:jg17288 [Pararge aegeria aegeria]|uniref:Jg17288 protein n=1 Tax=Pararge aegeria aegeria TaxID=348720 RepID=A0A8S4QZY6_9NEOP|nr:jg17288 [Pararge aegeria aegeria]